MRTDWDIRAKIRANRSWKQAWNSLKCLCISLAWPETNVRRQCRLLVADSSSRLCFDRKSKGEMFFSIFGTRVVTYLAFAPDESSCLPLSECIRPRMLARHSETPWSSLFYPRVPRQALCFCENNSNYQAINNFLPVTRTVSHGCCSTDKLLTSCENRAVVL